MAAASTLTTPADEAGVLFPLVDGRRSTTSTSRAVLAEATRAVAPEVAARIDAAKNWHRDYVSLLSDIEAASARSAKNALLVAGDGLASLHRQMVFRRDGEDVALDEAMRRH